MISVKDMRPGAKKAHAAGHRLEYLVCLVCRAGVPTTRQTNSKIYKRKLPEFDSLELIVRAAHRGVRSRIDVFSITGNCDARLKRI
ncbi:hypothetical protein [Ligaoa zhengdingensis]|uniref:hypothetical protein n=1 Tax=Ligaoa zhengdingensis TaxID=2763658 RepID=UPI0031BA3DCA